MENKIVSIIDILPIIQEASLFDVFKYYTLYGTDVLVLPCTVCTPLPVVILVTWLRLFDCDVGAVWDSLRWCRAFWVFLFIFFIILCDFRDSTTTKVFPLMISVEMTVPAQCEEVLTVIAATLCDRCEVVNVKLRISFETAENTTFLACIVISNDHFHSDPGPFWSFSWVC